MTSGVQESSCRRLEDFLLWMETLIRPPKRQHINQLFFNAQFVGENYRNKTERFIDPI
jgi:hypothetical protein